MLLKLNTLLQKLKDSGYTEQELINFISNSTVEFLQNDVDIEVVSSFIQPFIEVYLAKNLEDENSRIQILENTIFQYELLNETDYDIIKNDLLYLSKYDKVIERNSTQYFFLVDLLFQHYILHKQALGTFEDLQKSELRGITFSKSHSPEKIISKEHNAVKTAIASMPDNDELKFRNILYTEYKNNPHAVNKALYIVNSFGGVKSLSEEKNAYIANSRIIINSALPFKKKDIYKSANLLILLFFRKDSFWQQVLKRTSTISNNQLIDINSVLMNYVFDTKNQLNKDNVSQTIQAKDDFDITTLYEFRNDKNIKIHPMFEDTEDNHNLWNEVIDFFKKNIPPKSDDTLI
jgi:hypothetical protein